MKTQHLFALAIAGVAVAFVVLITRQSGLEREIAILRAESVRPAPIAAGTPAGDAAQTRAGLPSPAANRVGVPVALDPLEAAEERIADLERVLSGQADIIEGLLAESTRVAEAKRKAAMRAWGPEQAVGAPDTQTAGDQRSAWAPAVADGGVQWLQADFENEADLAKIVVRQTCNPGSITKVVAVTDTGAEIPIWAGEDPGMGKELDDTPFAVPAGIRAKRVRVYLDTSKVKGWEEIDAVQAVGRDGSQQWAKSVDASSTYASGTGLRGGLYFGETQLLFDPSGDSILVK